MNPWLSNLNPEQQEAVLHDYGPMLILAGAGSGKTTVLVHRTGRLVDEKICDPARICVLTFTNKAARELKERVSAKIGKRAKNIWSGTFHSFGLAVLKQFYKEAQLPKHFGILDQSDSQAIVRDLLKDVKNADKDAYDTEKLISIMGHWRERGQTKAKTDDEYEVMVEVILPKYISRLKALGVVDFEDLLLRPLKMAEDFFTVKEFLVEAFDQVMVDEFQDTNKVQMRLVRLLGSAHNNICVVGDDDQSIYGWRGAEISNILNFPSDFDNCHVVRLQRNYRSSSQIVSVANAIIAKNTKRHMKILISEAKKQSNTLPELFIFENEDIEAERIVEELAHQNKQGYAWNQMAVLYRSNGQAALLEAGLRRNRLPYKVNGGSAFFERKEIKDILAYLRSAFSPNELSLRRSINSPNRGIGETSIEKIALYAETKEISFWKALNESSSIDLQNKVQESIADYLNILSRMRTELSTSLSGVAASALLKILEDISYKQMIRTASKDAQAADQRWALVQSFANVLDSFLHKKSGSAGVIEFLDAMELKDILEDKDDPDKPEIQLMTFHASKGLEFPVCILAGIEEEILPHRTLGSDIDEERRLFYVAVTRAKEKLILTRALQRRRFGRMQNSQASRFLIELPENLFRTYYSGFRPLTEDDRLSMLQALLNK